MWIATTGAIRLPRIMVLRCFLLCCIPGELFGGEAETSPGPAKRNASFVLTIHEGLFSLRATQASLKEILDAIGRRMHIEVVTQLPADQTVTIAFDRLPLDAAPNMWQTANLWLDIRSAGFRTNAGAVQPRRCDNRTATYEEGCCMTGTSGGTRPMRPWPWTLTLLLSLIGLPALATAQPEVNVIKSMKTVSTGVELQLTSSRSLGVRNALVVLRIGTQKFTKSRSPEDGSLNTLIFTLTSEEFARTAPGDRIWVQYGNGPGWDFGTLDKRLLDKKAE
jgi:hypothetical protein